MINREGAELLHAAVAGPAMALAVGGPWLLDSGSTFDLIDRDRLGEKQLGKIQKSATATSMLTANGSVESNDRISLHCGTEKQKFEAIVLEKSPYVLSMGRRCLKEGFGFHWEPYKRPYLISPSGKELL